MGGWGDGEINTPSRPTQHKMVRYEGFLNILHSLNFSRKYAPYWRVKFENVS